MEDVRSVMLFLLVLAVVAIAMFISLTSIIDSSPSINTKTLSDRSFVAESFQLNTTGITVPAVANLTNVVLTGVNVTNSTSGEQIFETGNFSISGGTFTAPGDSPYYNSTTINVTATYAHDVDGDAVAVSGNVTNGTAGFFANVPTIFTILGAVVIITAIILILMAVTRISGVSGVGESRQ